MKWIRVFRLELVVIIIILLIFGLMYFLDLRVTIVTEFDLTTALLALSSIGTVSATIISFYHWVWIPHQKDKEEKREQICKPLLKDIDALIENVKQKKLLGLPFNWQTVEENVSTYLYEKIQKLFQEKAGNYYKLLKHNQDFIRYSGYFYLNSQIPELQKEYLSLGVGGLEFELYESIIIPLLEGEKITLRWLEDNRPELHENLIKCASYKKIKRLFNWLNKEDPCIVSLRKTEQDLLQLAEELRVELKKR